MGEGSLLFIKVMGGVVINYEGYGRGGSGCTGV